ncbi:MAG: translocation/assembly module TamB domain-containing protein [Endomicrobiales bacterium]|nr:translocation/assembly module TamB domain-containing protein [Endomicrobiales bacterium]
MSSLLGLSGTGTDTDKMPSFDISWNDGVIKTPYLTFTGSDGKIDISHETNGEISCRVNDNKLNLSVLLKKYDNTTHLNTTTNIEGGKINTDFTVDAEFKSIDYINASLTIAKLEWDDFFSFNNSSGTLLFSKSGINGNLVNNNGKIDITGKDFRDLDFSGNFKLNEIIDSSKGYVALKGKLDKEKINATMNIDNLEYKNLFFGNMIFNITRKIDGNLSGSLDILSADTTLDFSYSNLSDFTMLINSGSQEFGKIYGIISPLSVDIDIDNFPINKIVPFVSIYKSLDGYLICNGKLGTDGTNINFVGTNWKIHDTEPVSFYINLSSENDILNLKADSSNNEWNIRSRLANRNDWDFNVKFNKLKSQNILPWFKTNLPLAGEFTGDVVYSSKREGKINISLNNLFYDKTYMGDGRMTFWMTPKVAIIKNLSLHSGKGTITGHGQIGLESGNNPCNIALKFHNYPIKNNLIHGPLEIKGKLHRNALWEFTGKLYSEIFQFSHWPKRSLKAKINISKNEVIISELIWYTLAKGELIFDLNQNIVTGGFQLSNIPLENLVRNMQGYLEGEVDISGKMFSPTIKLKYRVPETKYKSITFTHNGKISLINKSVYFEEVNISTGTSKLELKGRIWPKLTLIGDMYSISPSNIKPLVKLPFNLDGSFTGPIKIDGNLDAPEITMELKAKNILIDKNEIDEIKFKLKTTKSNIEIENLVAKFKDSELHFLKDSIVDLQNKYVDLKTECRNIHLGPIDLFGSLNIKGNWFITLDKKVSITTVIHVKSLWINEHNLIDSTLGLKYENKTLTFLPQKNQELQISGNIDLAGIPQFKFQRLKINWKNEGIFILDGEIGKNKWEFLITGKQSSANALAEVLDLPIPMSGELDINLIGQGSLDKPELEGSLNLYNGQFAYIPFDNLNIQFNAQNDVLTLSNAKLIKKDQYSFRASGYIPFFLTKGAKKRVENNPLDLNINIEEGTLSFLKELSKDIKSARGDIKAQIHLTGTLSKPMGNGFLRITNATIQSKKYFQKLANLNVECTWDKNILNIDEFTGQIGQGQMQLNGNITFSGFKPNNYNLIWQSVGKKGISISVPQLPIPSPLFKGEELEFLSTLSKGDPRFYMHFNGPSDNILLSGWVELDNTHFSYPSLAKKGDEEDIFSGLWDRISWDLDLRSGKSTWYDNELVSVNIQGGIKLTGSGAYPTVNGSAESIRGSVTYLGTDFNIKRANFEVHNGQAYLEGEAETEVFGKTEGIADTIVMYVDKAQIQDIQPRFVSKNNSKLTSKEALSKATGIESLDSMSNSILRRQLVRFFDSSLATPIAKNLLRRSGLADSFRVQYVDKEQVEEETTGDSSNASNILSGTKYSLEKYLSDKVLLGYSVTFDEIANKLDLRHEIELSYRWKKNLFLKGLYQVPTHNPFLQYDKRITLEQRWRFGWPDKDKKDNKSE